MPTTQKWEPKELQAKHRVILRLKFQGKKNKDIAEAVGLTPQQVCYVVNSDIFRAELAKLTERADQLTVDGVVDTKQTLDRITKLALEVIEDSLRDPGLSKSKKLDGAFDVLEFAPNVKAANEEAVRGEKNVSAKNYVSAVKEAFERRKLQQNSQPSQIALPERSSSDQPLIEGPKNAINE